MSTSTTFDSDYIGQLLKDLQAVLLQTELGGNSDKVTEFSYAQVGNSTYSFGVMQFDVGANPLARAFLASIGFTPEEIQQLSQHGGLSDADLAPLNAKLAANAEALEEFTSQQLKSYATNLENVIGIVGQHAPARAQTLYGSPQLQLRLLDYVNQFGPISSNGPMCEWLCGRQVRLPGGTVHLAANHTLTDADISDFVMKTKFGVSDPVPEQSREARLADALGSITTAPAVAAATAGGDEEGDS